MIATTADRVTQNTCEETNRQIRAQTEKSVTYHANAGLDAINRRLAELDEEWDVERCLETLAPSFTLLGLCLGLSVNRKWLALPIVVQTFFLQHALQGWCPPIPILRRLGVRTAQEIEAERMALKFKRGDFQNITDGSPPVHLLNAVMR